MPSPAFEAPGSGTWEQDSTHFPCVLTPYIAEAFPEPFVRGFKEGSARYGLLFSHLEPAVVNGFMYYRDQGVDPGDEDEVGRRFEAADTALGSRMWRSDVELWNSEIKPDSIRRNGALQGVDLTALDTEELIGHLEAVRKNAVEMVYRHHKFSIPAVLPVGIYLARAMQWTGMDAGRILAPLKGSSPVSLGPRTELEALARALADAGVGPDQFTDVSPAEALGSLEARDDAVGEATRAYRDAIGLRLAGGYDIADPCAAELPELLLSSIWAALEGTMNDPVDDWENSAAQVRAAVPEEHREEFDRLLEEARFTSHLRDERGYYNEVWGVGIARTGILEAGRRLAAAGILRDRENALDATHDELVALLRGKGGPSAEELEERTRYRSSTSLDAAPPILGPPPEPPPPLDGLPPHVQTLMMGVGAAIGEIFGRGGEPAEAAVSGRAVSPGAYIGTARVIEGPDESDRIQRGDVLVTASTSAAFNVVLPLLGAIVTDRGGQLSHAAIVAREYGIPAVVGTRTATETIPDGARVRVDGTAGTVDLI